MKTGERINLTDGKGNLITTEILDEHRKAAAVRIIATQYVPHTPKKAAIGISLLKNTNRLEWFLEKATEIGVSEIYPLVSKRTEKEKFRQDRMQQICVSAMLQSQQVWMPVLHQPIDYEKLLQQEETLNFRLKFIAHCIETDKTALSTLTPINSSALLLIGPEGDFTSEEVNLAITKGFVPVSLGNTRLRTETAGIVAATFLCTDT